MSRAFQWLTNERAGTPGIVVLPAGGFRRAKAEITSWPGYAPTPLRDLPEWAARADVAVVRLKDESGRFGLGSFKALGGAYAVLGVVRAQLARLGVARSASSDELRAGAYTEAAAAITVTCATDGNHGRSLAWGARLFGARCVVFVHEGVSAGRTAAIAEYGAEMRTVTGTYDDSVRACSEAASQAGWTVVSDTSWPGMTEIPREVMQGYRLMLDEAADQWTGPPPTHIFVQGGVGGLAAAMSVQARARFDPVPRLIVVEPERAACLLASAASGQLTQLQGALDTVMAGLACGAPSLLAWQELERGASAFMSIPDRAAVLCLQELAANGIVIGESGVAGLAGYSLAALDPATRTSISLDRHSRILVFGTEGATDPVIYSRLLAINP